MLLNRYAETGDASLLLHIVAGDDAFVLGYPLRPDDTGLPLPLWKRATIATEVEYHMPYYLIDTATRPGMSGAPVFARHSGLLAADSDPSHGQPGAFYRFAGIYTGRVLHTEPEFQAQVGKAFKPDAIEEMLEAKNSGPNW